MGDLSKKVQEDINRILSHVDNASSQEKNGEIPTKPEEREETEQTAMRFVDIHVYHLQPGEEAPPSNQDQQPDSSIPPAPQRPKKRRHITFIGIGVCLIFLIGIGSTLFLSPLFTTATITIIPMSKQIVTTNTIPVVNGQVTGEQQIPGNTLAPVTMSQARTVAATGKGHQDAQPGHGYITFYNAAPYTQTVTAGTLLTGADGVQIVTDRDAVIPPVSYPMLGQASVPAHAVLTGPGGNIRANDVYGPCCRLNVSSVNSAFTGGQLARDFQVVTQSDIDTATASLKSSLNQSIQAALKTQVQSGQTLLLPLFCKQTIIPDHQAGAEATQVHVIVSEACTGATYNTESLHRFVTKQLDQQARRQLGEGYVQSGTIESTIIKATPEEHGSITLSVRSTANYSYQFTQEQQQQIKARIAGKSKAQATSILLQTPGVQTVSCSISQGSDQLPTNVNSIQLTFLVTM